MTQAPVDFDDLRIILDMDVAYVSQHREEVRARKDREEHKKKAAKK